MRRFSLAAMLVVALVPWAQLARLAHAALLSLLLAGCSAPARAPFPPGPTIAAHVLTHGQVGLAAAYRQDSNEALDSVKPTGDERAGWLAKAGAQELGNQRWLPVWIAWHDLRVAQLAYEDAAVRGEHPSDTEVIAALCRLRDAVPPRWRTALLPKLEDVCQ